MQTLQNMVILLLAMLVAAPSNANLQVAGGMLHADGILSVKGGRVEEAIITVIPADAPSYTLDKGTKRFMLDFQLNKTYLVTFEHPKCLTKQLYFDTNVPADYRYDSYDFPFEVILEVETRTRDKSYVGPVGHIRYMDLVNDFDFETDYTLKMDDRIKERMTAIADQKALSYVGNAADRTPIEAEQAKTSTPSGPSGTGRIDPAPGPSDPNVTRVGANNRAPAEPEIPSPAVDRIVPMETMEPVVSGSELEPIERPEPVTTPITEVPIRLDLVEEEAPAPPPARSIEKPEPVNYSPPARGTARVREAPDPSKFGRHEELLVEDNRVTTKVMIVNELGYGIEYRRVAHHFGAVFYFKDEQSITKDMYYEETGLPVEP